MKILHLIHTGRHSGAEMLVRDLCIQHLAMGDACAIAALAPSAEAFQRDERMLAEKSIAVFIPKAPLSGLARAGAYARTIRSFQPDLIFGHSLLPALYGRIGLLLSGSKAKFYPVLHSSTDDYTSAKVRLTEHLLQPLTAGVISVAQPAADRYRTYFGRSDVRVIHNGVDLGRFKAAARRRHENRAALGLGAEDKLILQIGRSSPIKQQMLSVEALAGPLRANPSWRFWLAGVVEDPAYHARLLEQISGLDLGDRLVFLGPRSDVPELLSATDVYIMPSVAENHSVAFLEAMASGVPIVATDIPSFAFAKEMEGVELIAHNNLDTFSQQVGLFVGKGRIHDRDLSEFDVAATARAYASI